MQASSDLKQRLAFVDIEPLVNLSGQFMSSNASTLSRLFIALLCSLSLTMAWGAEQLVLDGSTGMLPLAKALAAAYRQQSTDPHLEFGKGLGAGERLRAVADGKIQIALASHGVNPEELRKGKLKLVTVARRAIVFAASANVPLSNLSESQVCDVYSGKVQSWRSFGGTDELIAVLTRPPTELESEVIRAKIACFKDLNDTDSAKVLARGADMAKALASTSNAIGMTSMNVVGYSEGKLKALTLSGIAPTEENVRSGRYFLTRDLLFVVKEDAAPAVNRFIDFVLGMEGDRILRESSAIPFTASEPSIE